MSWGSQLGSLLASGTWWTFRIFFFCSGERKRESEAPGGVGGDFFSGKSQEGGGSSGWVPSRGGRGEGPGGCLRGICGGGGLNIFFGGPKFPPKISLELLRHVMRANLSVRPSLNCSHRSSL